MFTIGSRSGTSGSDSASTTLPPPHDSGNLERPSKLACVEAQFTTRRSTGVVWSRSAAWSQTVLPMAPAGICTGTE